MSARELHDNSPAAIRARLSYWRRRPVKKAKSKSKGKRRRGFLGWFR